MRTAVIGATLTAIALVSAAPAAGALERVRVRQGPFVVNPYSVRFTSPETRAVRAPRLDGWLVRMHARVVDRAGRPLPVSEVMLHHIVYKNASRGDGVCGDGQSFYGTGEEDETLRFPAGYGYRVRRSDRWLTGWMLMSHMDRPRAAYVEYTAWIETRRRLRSVIPYWVRVTGCHGRRDPIYSVRGGGTPGSTHVRTGSWRVPRSGRIVAAGSHVHGGSHGLALDQPGCRGRRLLLSMPLYGLPDHPYYNVLPVLHEPGPFATGWIQSAHGIAVRRGELLEVASLYDNERPHTRVMGIWHIYLAPGRIPHRRCPPLPRDRRGQLPSAPGRSEPPAVRVPLTGLDASGRAVAILRPPGPLTEFAHDASVTVQSRAFEPRNLAIPAGARITWRFAGPEMHDVTLADGPAGFASRWQLPGGTWTRRFDEPGEYRIFCSLHPVEMTQLLTVRSP